jgi:DNA-binding transcriptional ArsR family regulator
LPLRVFASLRLKFGKKHLLDRANTAVDLISQKKVLHRADSGLTFNHMVKCSPQLLDRTFAALADPTRRRILEHLAGGDRCVTDLARPYSMSLPAVSKHLRVLERAGLVRRRRDGRVHRLKLDASPMKDAQQWIEEYRRFWEERLDRLDQYLQKLQKENKNEHNE